MRTKTNRKAGLTGRPRHNSVDETMSVWARVKKALRAYRHSTHRGGTLTTVDINNLATEIEAAELKMMAAALRARTGRRAI